MASMLLINPKRRAAAPKRKPAQRKTNPARPPSVRVLSLSPARRKRHSPAKAARRKPNPIRMGGSRALTHGLLGQMKDAAVGGAGAVSVELLMGQINGFLPASLQRVNGSISVGDAIKAAVTVILGNLLAKPTHGLSRKMAAGALTVQAASLLRLAVPSSMTLGYATPARLVSGKTRVGPNAGSINQYVSGSTPLLNQYVDGPTPMLNSAPGSARFREGVLYR